MTPPPPPSTPPNWQWRHDSVTAGRAVVFDLDGVLSDAAARQHLVERRNWDAFFDACGDDPVVDEVGRLLGLLERDLAVILLTARPAHVRPQTIEWLARHQLRWDLLVMRAHRDFDSAREYKRRSVGELRARGWDLVLSFEDDPRNVAMFREEGVPSVYIHSGYFD